jgi:hypothetical protein
MQPYALRATHETTRPLHETSVMRDTNQWMMIRTATVFASSARGWSPAYTLPGNRDEPLTRVAAANQVRQAGTAVLGIGGHFLGLQIPCPTFPSSYYSSHRHRSILTCL